MHYSEDDVKALSFASAACALEHTDYGDVNIVSQENVLDLIEGDASGSIKRYPVHGAVIGCLKVETANGCLQLGRLAQRIFIRLCREF